MFKELLVTPISLSKYALSAHIMVLTIVGEQSKKYTPPPEVAIFLVKVQLINVGDELYTPDIPPPGPPHIARDEFPAMTQRISVGDELFQQAKPPPPMLN